MAGSARSQAHITGLLHMSNGRVQRPDRFRKGCHGGGSDDLAKPRIDLKGSLCAACSPPSECCGSLRNAGAARPSPSPARYRAQPQLCQRQQSTRKNHLSAAQLLHTARSQSLVGQTRLGDSGGVLLGLLGQIKAQHLPSPPSKTVACSHFAPPPTTRSNMYDF